MHHVEASPSAYLPQTNYHLAATGPLLPAISNPGTHNCHHPQQLIPQTDPPKLRRMYTGPEGSRARTIHQTLVGRHHGPMPEHDTSKQREAFDGWVAGNGIQHAAAIRAGVVGGAIILERGPLIRPEAWREIGRRG